MNTSVIRIVVLLFIAGLVGLGCKTTPGENHAPTITALTLPDSVDGGTDQTFSCTASDQDDDPLSYNWACSSGTLLSTTAKTVGWTAPERSGSAIVTVVVKDSSGASDTSSGTVAVKPMVTTILDWTGAVAGLTFQAWHLNFPVGYTVSGSFSAGAQRITFLVLDSLNYTKWDFRTPYEGLVNADSSMGDSFSVVIPRTGLYHFVLDNRDNDSSVTAVHLAAKTTSP